MHRAPTPRTGKTPDISSMKSKGKGKGKGLILIVLLSASAVSAFIYREEARILYLKTYYLKVKKISADGAVKKSSGLYREKKYEEAADSARDFLLIFPGNEKLLRIAGMSLLMMEDRIAGAKYLIPLIDGSSEDRALLRRVAETLFDERYYNDTINLLTAHSPGADPALNFYMGASLVNTGRHSEALTFLEKSESRGSNNPDVYFYLGLVHEKAGRDNAAMEQYRSALERNRFHRKARKALLDMYTRRKMFREAEILIRGTVL